MNILNTCIESEKGDLTLSFRSNLKRKAKSVDEDKTPPIFGHDTFRHIFSLGRAVGTPFSRERIEHLKTLSQDMLGLHIVIPRTENTFPSGLENFQPCMKVNRTF